MDQATTTLLLSVITPSRGDRPRALARAVSSVAAAAERANVADRVEMLVGFDGVKGERPEAPGWVRFFDFPRDNDSGNAIRNWLLKASRGERVVFLDDDNALTPEAMAVYLNHRDVELLIARIDTSLAFEVPFLPRDDGSEAVRQTNIDPLCLCATRDLVVNRCGGWTSEGGYEAGFVNMRRYARRAKSRRVVSDMVGVYDAGAGLDAAGVSELQLRRLKGRS